MSNLKMLMSIAMLTPMDDPRSTACRWGAPFLLMGPPGEAKTSFITQVAARMLMPCETMYLSTHQPEDMSGIPVMTDGHGRLVNFVPQISRLGACALGVLSLDELTTARESTQNAAMNLVLERTIAGERLPLRIRIAAAANPPEQAAAARDLSPPAANRFLHFDVENLTLPQVIEHERRKSLPLGTALPPYEDEKEICTVDEGERTVKSNWVYAHNRAVDLFSAFHRATGNKLRLLPPVGNPGRGRAWASPRSWTMGVAAMATAAALAHEECSLSLLAAAVGLDMATEYAGWLADFDLPLPADVLSGKWTPDKLRLDIAATAYRGTVLHVLNEVDVQKRYKLAAKLWTALGVGANRGLKDVIIPTAEDLVQRGFATKSNDPAMWAAADPVLNELGPHLQHRLPP